MNTTRATIAEPGNNALSHRRHNSYPSSAASRAGISDREELDRDVFAICSPRSEPSLYTAVGAGRQVAEPPVPSKITVVQSSVWFSDEFLEGLQEHGMAIANSASPEDILRRLTVSPTQWDLIVYPIAHPWQRALDFTRAVRRIRERNGGTPYPRVLVLSFAPEHLPITVHLFLRVQGTQYATFTGADTLVQVLRGMCNEIVEARRASQKLHLRLVHAGNPKGLGCTPGEKLVAIYGSLLPGHEKQVTEMCSVLNFLNLLAMNHWQFRTAREIIRLMRESPFYGSDGTTSVLSLSSVKTYVGRVETEFQHLWSKLGCVGEAPAFIAREPRGGKEVAYRLLCSFEIDHI